MSVAQAFAKARCCADAAELSRRSAVPREGETTNDVFAFLTTDPNAEVGAVHPKAMPVILMTDATRG